MFIQNNRLCLFLAVLIFIITMSSCKTYRKKTFLDFEFGMSYSEYIQHARDLQKSGFIKNLNGRDFDYYIKLPNDKFAFFHVRVNVFSNARLSTIYANLQYNLNDDEKRQLYYALQSKHGTPTQQFEKNKENNLWYAVWDQDNSEVRLILGDYDQTLGNGEIIFSAEGSLYDNIKEKDKKENGIIDVDNKY